MAGSLTPTTPSSSSIVVPQFQYLGAYASAPTTRPNGSTLQSGDFYFNETTPQVLTWDAVGAAWVATSVASTAAASAAAAAASEAAAAVSETNAAASAATIPAPVALNFIRGNAGATAYEAQTPAQVLADIGAKAAGTEPISTGGTGQTTAQAAIDALTAVAAATDEHVLTKDTASGNAIWKAATGGSGAVNMPVLAKTGAYTVVAGDAGKVVDCTTGTFTVTLTAAATLGDGFTVVIKNSGTGIITIDANASETIDGALTKVLGNQYDSVILVCDGSNWQIVGAEMTNSVVKTATKNLTDASTTQSITGVGFTPSSVDVIAGINAGSEACNGTFDGTSAHCIYSFGATSIKFNISYALVIIGSGASGTTNQIGTITFTADGCDIAWVKTGTPTGTANLMLRFYR